ncbi:hypothetical protein EHQ12_11965 [Leptospira gomenensis]|uniref:Cys-rich protein n=1 Tax=Leptospira gomenensis TaxID=2484974 RepID=A0A5F1Y966_9LEPT|nr:hypothetical protein [Leptospira gomenensis]TGK32654.1 hypothetical protein EHQ17_11810 [Leptospira gomenensis]TGK36802.1 hypothetical protein EHQ12_11965 [Leptospira gomenensis]TGK46373.1 hypothetical protein EHQ07_06280 [Leptospira gomenensis]TGK65317.1 hypothetical protein EHQ13_05155 [Leptospira gomenensis]
MKKIQILLVSFCFLFLLAFVQSVSADGCYICTSGSSDLCRDYCRYVGSDSFDNRKKCQDRGCKVGGTASCPSASNYKVCSAKSNIDRTSPFLSLRR